MYPRRQGFTLIELLVVISIIALLIAMLMPSLGYSRYQARVTICGGALQQWGIAMNSYASDHDGKLPRPDQAGTGANLWDVSNGFYNTFKNEYDMPHKTFFCSESPESLVADGGYNTYGYFTLIGYSLWLQRTNGSVVVPPNPGDNQGGRRGRGNRDDGPEPEPVAGPARIDDAIAIKNPIMTDLVGTTIPGPTDVNLHVEPREDTKLDDRSNHQYNGKLDVMQQVFADAHVERVPGGEVKFRYAGNWNNWR